MIDGVVRLVVESMRKDANFESVMRIDVSGPLVFRVFVEGNAGSFFSGREAIVDVVCG